MEPGEVGEIGRKAGEMEIDGHKKGLYPMHRVCTLFKRKEMSFRDCKQGAT